MEPHHLRMAQLRDQIRPMVREVSHPSCPAARREQIVERLIMLYQALFALQEELDLN